MKIADIIYILDIQNKNKHIDRVLAKYGVEVGTGQDKIRAGQGPVEGHPELVFRQECLNIFPAHLYTGKRMGKTTKRVYQCRVCEAVVEADPTHECGVSLLTRERAPTHHGQPMMEIVDLD
ncbi:MAG: hypothetical protein GXO65_06800 [Euryarchaeota archaeon]|nr:hypothetical protein [Euryarchaeota archaeon]